MEGRNNPRNIVLFVSGLILAAAVSRILPHWPNVTPVAAIALFGGATLSNRKWAYGIPMLALLLSDLAICGMMGYDFFTWGRLFIYVPFLFTTFLGTQFQNKRTIGNIAAYGFLASVVFFLISNLSVWIFDDFYTRDFTGLIDCYTMAIPFFRNSLLGNAFYMFMLFGSFALAKDRFFALARVK
ncbi:MAG: hypothetical protein H6585_07775 [Flavobacteriales bacterium]|nr:hypothetical protein [Flavobacteriales bacterium]MCB9448225.1 hypothetical protein [Flavobacteriales bacterium]